jgi:hypothetical protein
MQLAVWTYEGPPHVGAMRIATAMAGVHYVLHAPQGDTPPSRPAISAATPPICSAAPSPKPMTGSAPKRSWWAPPAPAN